jgi:hypothetical protein
LRDVANAITLQSYDQALVKLHTSVIWKSNNRLQQWFSRTLISQHKVS